MKQDIHTLYHNELGISFTWKRARVEDRGKIQMVFRDTGLLFHKEELVHFAKMIADTKTTQPLCNDCKQNEQCRSLLLQTPSPQISFAVSYNELRQLDDLLKGTLFQLDLDSCLGDIL